MKLYEISLEIENAINCLQVDEETGEIINAENLEQLEIEFKEKAENIGLFIKNLDCEINAIKDEEKALSERRKSKEKKAENLKKYLSKWMLSSGNENIETSRILLKHRTSSVVEVDDNFVSWAKENNDTLLNYKEPTADKTAIKQAIKDGLEINHAFIIEKQNLQIK